MLNSFKNKILKKISLNLKQIRKEIDHIDEKLLDLFQKRMNYSRKVANYKKGHNQAVFDKNRECKIINKIKERSLPKYKNSAVLFFSHLMDISRYFQYDDMQNYSEQTKSIIKKANENYDLPKDPKVGYFGIEGSYCNKAALKYFPDREIKSYKQFSEVFDAVNDGKVDFGVLPIRNSTAGSVNMVYSLLNKNDLYINDIITLKISHCIATNKNNKAGIKEVISHYQVLDQCSNYISNHKYKPTLFNSSADAALFVSKNNKQVAAICSKETAVKYGLEIIDENIQNNKENYTRFIVISKNLYLSKKQNVISIIVTIPNSTGSLNKLLTNFSVRNVNIIKIESQPIGDRDFNVIFYLDFYGNINDKSSINLINSISFEAENLKFLGCYKEDNNE